jgi:hypothetical protein
MPTIAAVSAGGMADVQFPSHRPGGLAGTGGRLPGACAGEGAGPFTSVTASQTPAVAAIDQGDYFTVAI